MLCCGYSVESIDLKSRTPNQLSDKITCTVGFINCFLKVPIACLGCRVWYINAMHLSETVYKTYSESDFVT